MFPVSVNTTGGMTCTMAGVVSVAALSGNEGAESGFVCASGNCTRKSLITTYTQITASDNR